MPVRIRLAMKGGSRNENVFIELPLFNLGEGVHQQVDVVVEELEIVGDFLDAAYRGQQNHDLSADRLSDGIGRAQIEVRFHQYQLDAGALHGVDQLQGVARGRWNAGPRFDVVHHLKAEALAEAWPGTVIGDYLA